MLIIFLINPLDRHFGSLNSNSRDENIAETRIIQEKMFRRSVCGEREKRIVVLSSLEWEKWKRRAKTNSFGFCLPIQTAVRPFEWAESE